MVQSRTETLLPKPFSLDVSNNNYRDKRQNYPKSIQDVLKENSSNNMERIGQRNFTFNVDKSVLRQFKPNDPSEVNLLATTSFRFSPMVGIGDKKQIPRGRHVDNKFNIVDMIREKKPFVMTLNVIPVENEKEVQFFDNMWKMKTQKQQRF
nr:unnamed protein product [Callosobruchus chinensis]